MILDIAILDIAILDIAILDIAINDSAKYNFTRSVLWCIYNSEDCEWLINFSNFYFFVDIYYFGKYMNSIRKLLKNGEKWAHDGLYLLLMDLMKFD